MSFVKKIRDCKFFKIVVFILFYLVIYYNFYLCNFISGDEGYQLAISNYSFGDIIHYCSIDYHVPLFAFLVKIFSYLPVSNVFSSRLLLSLIAIAHFFVAFFPLERLTNKNVSLIYAITFLLSPMLIYFILQIRMYSLANLNTFCVFIYALLVLKYNKKSDWAKLFIFSVLGCYSFLLTMCITFIILGFCILYCFKNRNYNLMRKYIICFVLIFLSFSPWLPILFKQFFNLNSGRYWSYFPTGFSFIINISSIFITNHLGYFCNNSLVWAIGMVLLLLILVAFVYNLFIKKINRYNFIIIFSCIIICVSFFVILLYSYLENAFALRYFSIIYSLLLFGVIYYFTFNVNNFIKVSGVLFLLLFSINYYYVSNSILDVSNNELNQLVRDIDMYSNGDDVVILHPIEASLEILFDDLKEYRNFILYDYSCVDRINVLRNYDMFGGNTYVVNEIEELNNYGNKFYMLNIIEKKYFDICMFKYFDMNNIEYSLINRYVSNYNNTIFELYELRILEENSYEY